MAEVPIRQLNQQTATVMARVERGETIEITKQGKVIGRIVPAASGELDDWIAAGKAVPAVAVGPFTVPKGEIEPDHDAAELIRQMRDEERW